MQRYISQMSQVHIISNTLSMKAKGKNNGTGYMYRYIVYTHLMLYNFILSIEHV